MNKILDNDFYDFIIGNNLAPSYSARGNITPLNDKHSLLHLQKSDMNAWDLGVYPYDYFPSLFTLMSKTSIEKSGILNIWQIPNMNLFGLGVVIGIVDTGIDYQHPAFRNCDGTSRILSIWDQTEETGTPPEGFTFGSEYIKKHIDAALKSPNPLSIVPTEDKIGHGTAIASVACGTPNNQEYFSGVAPQTKLAVVKLKEAKSNLKNVFFVPENALCYQESDLILGIRYLLSVSDALDRPLVLCIAMGSNQGGHDGHGPVSSYLNQIVKIPKINAVIAAGNEGDAKKHYFSRADTAPFQSSFYLNAGSCDSKFSMEIWPFPSGRMNLTICSPHGESIQEVYSNKNTCQNHVLSLGQTSICINNFNLEGNTGDQLILIRMDHVEAGIWSFQIENLENEPFSFHSWLPSGNLISKDTFFCHSSPDTTITVPGDARNPLTAAAYNQFDGSILPQSGRGYARFGEIIPDIAAPGYQIPCALPGNQYGTITGTGAAAAHAAGCAAMVVEWGFCRGNHTGINGIQANRIIIRGARREEGIIYPNPIWGYGKIDVYRLFERISALD